MAITIKAGYPILAKNEKGYKNKIGAKCWWKQRQCNYIEKGQIKRQGHKHEHNREYVSEWKLNRTIE